MGPYDNDIDPEDAFSSRCRFNAALIVCTAVCTRSAITWRLNEIHSMAVKYKEIDEFDNNFNNAE